MSIKKLLIELEEYPKSENDSCSCHIAPPCSYCVDNGTRAECVERIKDKVAGDKYLQYMVNADTGDGVPITVFEEDWEPIGGTLLSNMVDKGEVELQGFTVYLVEDLYNALQE